MVAGKHRACIKTILDWYRGGPAGWAFRMLITDRPHWP